jgi:restriction endonuclease S subunit
MEEIENVVVPVVPYEIQQQIAELIEKSFYLCRESEKLLNDAKDMVEMEIKIAIGILGDEKENKINNIK